MSPSWAFFTASALSVVLAVNVLRPPFAPGALTIPTFFAGWLVGELAPQVVVALVLATAVFVRLGALAAWPGFAGVGLAALACVLLAVVIAQARRAREAFDRALREAFDAPAGGAELGPARAWLTPALGARAIALPFPVRHPAVACERNIPFWRELRLDAHRSRSTAPGGSGRAPILVYVHGGGWIIGQRQHQGLPLIQHLAARGWVCFSVDYRLSPAATFPDHLVDVKRAIAWVRDHAAEYGGDADFLVLAGNSAGGHLASLAALTANDPAYQPGFEASDTSVQACAAFYGVYDFLDRFGHWPHRGMQRLLERQVMKRRRAEDPAAFDAASPLSRVHPGAPPFLLVHGTLDSLCPVAEARRFSEALRARSRDVVAYAEIPGAQHAFEVFPSLRTAHVLDGVTRFLAHVHERGAAARAAASSTRPSGFRRDSERSRAAGT